MTRLERTIARLVAIDGKDYIATMGMDEEGSPCFTLREKRTKDDRKLQMAKLLQDEAEAPDRRPVRRPTHERSMAETYREMIYRGKGLNMAD